MILVKITSKKSINISGGPKPPHIEIIPGISHLLSCFIPFALTIKSPAGTLPAQAVETDSMSSSVKNRKKKTAVPVRCIALLGHHPGTRVRAGL